MRRCGAGTTRRRTACRVARAALAALGLLGCSGDLGSQTLVDRFRILAVRADVPDAEPGQAVTLDALVADPTGAGRALAWLWVACHLGPARDPAECADPARGRILGLGFGPSFTFTAPAPAEGETEAVVMVTLSVCAGGTFVLPDDGGTTGGTPGCAGGDGATSYKRVLARDATERNHNPALAGLTLAGVPWTDADASRPACDAGSCKPLAIAAALGDGAAEPWTEIVFGAPQQRTEEPYVSWFATAGSFERTRSGGSAPDVQWTPPAGPATVEFWFVLHDGRGGTDWLTRRLVLPAP
jgi:hypothetical protein